MGVSVLLEEVVKAEDQSRCQTSREWRDTDPRKIETMTDAREFAVVTPNTSASDLLEMFRRVLRIRRFEERVSFLCRTGEIPGFVHLSLGQEATAVGACWPLRPTDRITSTHRGHGHCLAKGLDPKSMFAELMGRESGTNHGRGGSMHIADPELGIFGANGIVAAGLPIAVGAATASRIRNDDAVTVAFFGDGAPAQGAFHEAVNLAALWRLPIVFFCENNGYAEFSSAGSQHPVGLAARAAGYGIAHRLVDGNDVRAVAQLMTDEVRSIREGGGPVLVEAMTYRWHGHYEGDPELYRDAIEVNEWKEERDPVGGTCAMLLEHGVEAELLDGIDADVIAEIDAAVDQARAAPPPSPETLQLYVLQPEGKVGGDLDRDDPGEEVFRVMDAVHDALETSLAEDDSVFVAGIDVGEGGNVFALTRGLKDRFPTRVLDTPISETAVVGLALGSAMAGMCPVVEIMYLDFIGVCFDQILNQAAKMNFMTGGKASLGLTIRTQFGAGKSSGSQHSQSLEALLAHIPGLKVVMPSNPADTYGLLRASILDPNPVVFIEHRHLYGMRGPKPRKNHIVPLGKAKVVRKGSDITVISYSRMVHEALAAADMLAGEGIDVEVIDLRTIVPLDLDAVIGSVRQTARLVIAHEAVMSHGVGAELAALAAHDAFWSLDAPIRRVGAPRVPPPYAPELERVWLPARGEIATAITETLSV